MDKTEDIKSQTPKVPEREEDRCIDGGYHVVDMRGWGPPEIVGYLKPGEQRSAGGCLKCGKCVF